MTQNKEHGLVRGKAVETNVRKLRSKLSKDCQFMAVVKADGYGHDAKLVSEYAQRWSFAIRCCHLKEGIKLRSSELKNQFLFSEAIQKGSTNIFKNDLMPTISSMRECLIAILGSILVEILFTLKVDTGMSRLGFECNQFEQEFERIKSFEIFLLKEYTVIYLLQTKITH